MGKRKRTLSRLKLKSLAHFTRQISTAQKLGLPFSRSLPLIARESKDRRLQRTLRAVTANIAAGHTLAKALRACGNRFPPLLVQMVHAAEKSGHLESVFMRLSDYFDNLLKLRRAFIRASVYPAIQLTVAYAVFCLIVILFSHDRQAMTGIIALATIGSAAVLGFGYLFFLRTSTGRSIWDRLILIIPVVRSVTIKMCMARFTRTLSLQLESAVPIAEAVERASLASGNMAVAANFRQMAKSIRNGASLAEVAEELSFVTPLIREALVLGEEMGDFGDALERAADTYEDEAMLVMESVPQVIGPIVVVFVGFVVLFLFLTLFNVIGSAF